MHIYLPMSVSSGLSRVEDQGKAKVSNAGSQIVLQKDILTFEVSVCNSGFEGLTSGGWLLLMYVHQPTGHGLPNLAQLSPGHKIGLETNNKSPTCYSLYYKIRKQHPTLKTSNLISIQ